MATNPKCGFPTVAKLAINVLSIPAMSAEREQVLSQTKRLITNDQNRLGELSIGAVQCQKNWLNNRAVRSSVLDLCDLPLPLLTYLDFTAVEPQSIYQLAKLVAKVKVHQSDGSSPSVICRQTHIWPTFANAASPCTEPWTGRARTQSVFVPSAKEPVRPAHAAVSSARIIIIWDGMSGSMRQAGEEVSTAANGSARATADWTSQVNEEMYAVVSQVTRATRGLTAGIAREASGLRNQSPSLSAVPALPASPAMASMPAVSRGCLWGLNGGVPHIEAEFRDQDARMQPGNRAMEISRLSSKTYKPQCERRIGT